jgi:osmoprotectant transport system substrate-binding protein
MRATRRWKLLAVVLALGLVAAACGDSSDSGDTKEGPPIVIRGQQFSESVTTAEVYGQYLEAKGYEVLILPAAGFRTEAHDALAADELGLIIDYIGGAQAALAPDAPPSSDPEAIMALIRPAFAEIGGTLLEYSEAVDGDALVVRGDDPATKISDLAAGGYVFGSGAACAERPQCLIGYTDPDIYGITFDEHKIIDFGPLLGEALKAEEVDVVVWNTTAVEIPVENFRILDDDQGLHPAQNIAPIVLTDLLSVYGDLEDDLNELSSIITTDDLLEWNTGTDLDKRESDDVAQEWLEAKGLLG